MGLSHNFREIYKKRDDVPGSAESCVETARKAFWRRTVQCLYSSRKYRYISKIGLKKIIILQDCAKIDTVENLRHSPIKY